MKLTCKQCGKTFKKAISQVRNGEGKYCSKECYTSSMKGIDLFNSRIRGKKSRVRQYSKPKRKRGELRENLEQIIRSQALLGTARKVQRLEAESRTDSNASTSALPEREEIVRTYTGV